MTEKIGGGVIVLIALHILEVIKESKNGFIRLSGTSVVTAATLSLLWLRATASATIVILSATPAFDKYSANVRIRF